MVFILFIAHSSFVKSEEFTKKHDCLYGCLNLIQGSRYIYDVVLFSIHNSLEEKLQEFGASINQIKDIDENRHRVVELLLRDDTSSRLVSARKELIQIYEKLYVDCLNKKREETFYENDSLLPDRSLFDGRGYFDILKVLGSKDFKYKVENFIAKGLGVGMNDVDYDPEDLSFKVRVGKSGKILLNERNMSYLKEKFRVKRLAGAKLSAKELEIEKHALEPAHFIYQGTINVLDHTAECKSVSRGGHKEEYCPKGLSTFFKKTDLKTGKILSVSESSYEIRPFYISDNLRGNNLDQTARGNLSQVNSTLRLIQNSICKNRREIYIKGSKNSGFPFNIPCAQEVKFQFPAPITKY